MKKIMLSLLVMLLLCSSGSKYQTQIEYHQRMIIQYQKQVNELNKKITYHQQKVYEYQNKK